MSSNGILVVRRDPEHGWGVFWSMGGKAEGDDSGPWYRSRKKALRASSGLRWRLDNPAPAPVGEGNPKARATEPVTTVADPIEANTSTYGSLRGLSPIERDRTTLANPPAVPEGDTTQEASQ